MPESTFWSIKYSNVFMWFFLGLVFYWIGFGGVNNYLEAKQGNAFYEQAEYGKKPREQLVQSISNRTPQVTFIAGVVGFVIGTFFFLVSLPIFMRRVRGIKTGLLIDKEKLTFNKLFGKPIIIFWKDVDRCLIIKYGDKQREGAYITLLSGKRFEVLVSNYAHLDILILTREFKKNLDRKVIEIKKVNI